MRQERTVQASIFDLFAGHEIGRELNAMSQWLDEHRELIGLVAEDLPRHGVKETGRRVCAEHWRRLQAESLGPLVGFAHYTAAAHPEAGRLPGHAQLTGFASAVGPPR
jgi:IS5 family transposase